MVKFKLVEKKEEYLVYHYFPEGEEDKKPGIILVDRAAETIRITELAEEDSVQEISPEELNVMGNAINQMELERGGSAFVEMVTKPSKTTAYGGFAVRRIAELINSGKIPEKGMAMWY